MINRDCPEIIIHVDHEAPHTEVKLLGNCVILIWKAVTVIGAVKCIMRG